MSSDLHIAVLLAGYSVSGVSHVQLSIACCLDVEALNLRGMDFHIDEIVDEYLDVSWITHKQAGSAV